jgi:hypothetical protein
MLRAQWMAQLMRIEAVVPTHLAMVEIITTQGFQLTQELSIRYPRCRKKSIPRTRKIILQKLPKLESMAINRRQLTDLKCLRNLRAT